MKRVALKGSVAETPSYSKIGDRGSLNFSTDISKGDLISDAMFKDLNDVSENVFLTASSAALHKKIEEFKAQGKSSMDILQALHPIAKEHQKILAKDLTRVENTFIREVDRLTQVADKVLASLILKMEIK